MHLQAVPINSTVSGQTHRLFWISCSDFVFYSFLIFSWVDVICDIIFTKPLLLLIQLFSQLFFFHNMLIWLAVISEQSLSNRHTTNTTFIGHHSQFVTLESLWKKLSLDLFLVKRLHAMMFITAWCDLHTFCNTFLLDIHANAGRYVICLLNYLLTMQCGSTLEKYVKCSY